MVISGPHITEAQIARWVGDKVFGRGCEYHRDGAIFNPRKTGLVLKAGCLGRSEESYSVRVICKPKTIKGAVCTCPFEDGVGRCKHVAALLLTWISDPGRFIEIEPIETLLAGLSNKELRQLLVDLVDEQPQLELVLVRLIKGDEALAGLMEH
ncbi:MAG: hypothetical protein A3E37_02925 [Candidatus Andersenbacteria bacterium RIFCSPHIGHO2_12_FULL_46_9]|nr:MAG: hypothetical protein UW94_C0007G0005 [Parcubacteria group bacterium GW2011_GWA2_45_14]OGY33003.1 MAG: hypothetical protein A3B76_01160 [Candidatus Andersenbacteria bacterium RIFCSPHIGHO2_02_FULL_46_16]OGY36551.1 MAG: hypothetical protein A3E37_02925 [Candidatus Andersenbacteria bacterium RIFCSPHIGHO2_12_FULL_46_9]OGY37154.1 MAG: hypothetical protein A3I08_02220 [Candidatus Andersenbacteria bacterium RIFCSPLOWO2_02_FULL_46_11]OGY39520.1 MAG: hypothetical protein A3G57_04365 [Candidatus A